MPALEVAGLLLLAGLGWFWLDSLKARDAAVAAARRACSAEGLQLLDDSVAIVSIKPARNEDGRIELQRAYSFEFSDTGDNRRRGSVILLGHDVSVIDIGPRLIVVD